MSINIKYDKILDAVREDDGSGNLYQLKEPLQTAKHYTGFPDKTSLTVPSALSWVDGALGATRTLTLVPSGASHDVYIDGVKYAIGTLTKQIDDTTGLYWFWITAPAGVPQLNADVNPPGFDKCLVATVYWNTTIDKGVLSDERHWMGRDKWYHEYLHQTVGARWYTGGTLTFPTSSTFKITQCEIYDEDIQHILSEATTCKVFYKNGSANWEWDTGNTTLKKKVSGAEKYNSGNNLTSVSNSNHFALWVFATNNISEPFIVIIGQREDVTLASARANNTPDSISFGTLPSAEMKLLYRVICKQGTTAPIEVADYRSVSNLPVSNYTATDHSVLNNLGLSVSGHTGSSADLAGIISDETGTGRVVFNDSPTISSLEVTGTGVKVSGTIATETHADANVYAGVLGGTPRIILGGSTTHEIDNSSGDMRFFRPGALDMVLTSLGLVGIGTNNPYMALEVNQSVGSCLRLTYNDDNGSATNYTDFTISSSGDLTVTPSGGDAVIDGNISADNLSGTNTGNVALASPNHGLGLTGQTITLGTPSSITTTSTNAVTTTTHTHAITAALGLIGNGSAQYQLPVTGGSPYAPTWTTATGTGSPVLATAPTLAGATMSADLNFAKYKAVALTCDNGATAPASPTAGQWFLHTPTGRSILMMYNGSAWSPIISFGTMVVYVDNTDGTDAIDKGTGVDAAAFKTVQYAINMIPPTFSGNVTININDETYSESISIKGKNPSGDYTITLQGTQTVSVASSANNIAQATTILKRTTCGTSGKGWSTNAYKGYWVELKDSGGTSKGLRCIWSNTADTLTIAGYWTSDAAATDTYIVYAQGTVITASAYYTYTLGANQKFILFNKIKISATGATYVPAIAQTGTDAQYDYCSFVADTAPASFLHNMSANGVYNYCYHTCNTASRYAFGNFYGSITQHNGCLFETTGATPSTTISNVSALLQLLGRCVLTNTNKPTTGVNNTNGSALIAHGVGTDYIKTCVNNCTTGIYFQVNSFSSSIGLGTTGYVNYTNCTTNISVLASSNCFYNE